MSYFLLLILSPFIYVISTALFASIYKKNNESKTYEIKDLAYYLLIEIALQFIVFIMLPFDLLRKWGNFKGDKEKMVILLPGYTETQFIFYKLKKRLSKKKIGYEVLRYHPFLGSLSTQINALENSVLKVIQSNPNIKIYLVGHSMGGLIGRKYVETCEYSQIKKLIMVSTPHKGTILAKLAIGRSSIDFSPKSNFINELKTNSLHSALNIYSEGDNLIVPPSSLQYFDKNFILKNSLLHNSTMFSNESLNIMLNEIESA